jgi:aconitate hydratase
LVQSGAILRTAFCGPCFGAGDVPANGGLSIRHSTRNFPNREGSKPGEKQIAAVALMDSRSIAATAARGGILTPATDLDIEYSQPNYHFDSTVYQNRVYNGFGKADPDSELVFGPGIADWPQFLPAADSMLLQAVCIITDPVTTTDELIPSGETSSYRSNPEKLSSFALSRKDPTYVEKAKEVRRLEAERRKGEIPAELSEIYRQVAKVSSVSPADLMLGSLIVAVKPGDGSAREQAASCQRVLGGLANIAVEYATKRYRSNLINWGMLPFTYKGELDLQKGEYLLIENLHTILASDTVEVPAKIIGKQSIRQTTLLLENLSADERKIIADGCLINHYRQK